jgi:hypothetical protein
MDVMLWRRLDVAGHDAARLSLGAVGPELEGMAVFHDDGGPSALRYRVRCDQQWRTTDAEVDGWRNDRAVALRITRDAAGSWTLNGRAVSSVQGCVDLDLSFTPATNLLPLRRLRLAPGAATAVRSAWLAWPAAALEPLPQRYARQPTGLYTYEAELPDGSVFAADLAVDAVGWVTHYPGLWRSDLRGG